MSKPTKSEHVALVDAAGELRALADIEREAMAFAITRHRGNRSAAARALGVGRSTIYRHFPTDDPLPASED